MALYVQPVLWVVLAVFALIGLKFIWLTLVGELVSVWGGSGMGWWWSGNGNGNGNELLTECSHCACSYDHEYAGILTMRQVQSSERLCFECDIWLGSYAQCCGRHGQQLVQEMIPQRQDIVGVMGTTNVMLSLWSL
jgi:hypothetical protein